jgi:DnaA family protein
MSVSVEHPQLPLGLSLRDSARFVSYFAGDNGEAVAALQSVADGSGESLLYLAGQRGMGKTHLLQAACHQAGKKGLTTAYLPLQELSTLSPEMLDGLEQMALVCLDDVDVVAGNAEWEAAVFNLFNRVRAAGNAMLIAGTEKPAQCGFDLPDLVSRLGWGLTYTLRPLDEAQLSAALVCRAQGRGLELPDETVQFLLKRMPRDLTSVFNLLDRLDEASMIEQRRLTIPFVKSVLGLS